MNKQISGRTNPFLTLDEEGKVLSQLKLSLVFYLDHPPSPKLAGQVCDRYFAAFGSKILVFQSTGRPGFPLEWNAQVKQHFETTLLPSLQKRSDWGYVFSDYQTIDGNLFMFHGYKPATEPGKASFFRFEWPWNAPTEDVLRFAVELTDVIPFLSGTGGYILSAKPLNIEAFNQSYAVCQRYWGVEAWELDKTVKYVLHGYKCPSWLTLIGNKLLKQTELLSIDRSGIDEFEIGGSQGFIYRSRSAPDFIDRNRIASYAPEAAISGSLLPLQIISHEDFSGPRWEGKTVQWLHRFEE